MGAIKHRWSPKTISSRGPNRKSPNSNVGPKKWAGHIPTHTPGATGMVTEAQPMTSMDKEYLFRSVHIEQSYSVHPKDGTVNDPLIKLDIHLDEVQKMVEDQRKAHRQSMMAERNE